MVVFSVITVRLQQNSVDVTEATTSIQICVNVTQGIVESSAYVYYSTVPGTATCKYNSIANMKFIIAYWDKQIKNTVATGL